MWKAKSYLITSSFIALLTVNAVCGGYDVKGRLTDSSGVNRNGIFAIRFGVFNAGSYGQELWGKTISNINIKDGLFQVILEGKDDLNRNFDGLVENDALYLEIKLISGPGVTGQEAALSPRQKLGIVPFAIMADSVSGERALQGIIAMWSGSTAEIPDGWCLCDGRTCEAPDGAMITTPDLRDRFMLGTSVEAEIGEQSGTDNPSIDPPETQTSNLQADYYVDSEPGLDGGASKVRWHYVDIPPFQMGEKALYPKYFKVAFIMRL